MSERGTETIEAFPDRCPHLFGAQKLVAGSIEAPPSAPCVLDHDHGSALLKDGLQVQL